MQQGDLIADLLGLTGLLPILGLPVELIIGLIDRRWLLGGQQGGGEEEPEQQPGQTYRILLVDSKR